MNPGEWIVREWIADQNKTIKRNYFGILARKIPFPPLPLEFDGAVTPERGEEYARAVDARAAVFNQTLEMAGNRCVEALFAHFSVPLGDWQALCMSLACQHVPGFQIAAKRGRRPGEGKWAPWELEKLRVKVAGLKKSNPGGKSDRGALRRLLKEDEWVKRKGIKKFETLENRLQEAKSQAKLFKRLAK